MQAHMYSFSTLLVVVWIATSLAWAASTQDGVRAQETDPNPPNPPNPPKPPTCEVNTKVPSANSQKLNFENCIVTEIAAYIKIGGDKVQYGDFLTGKVDAKNSKCDTKENPNPKLVINYDCADLEIEFTKNEKDVVYIKSILGKFKSQTPVKFSNTSDDKVLLFQTSDTKHYYKCDAEQSVKSTQNSTDDVELVFTNLIYEVYRGEAKTTDLFKTVEVCALSSSGGFGFFVYAIAIVVIIIVAYFVVSLVRRRDNY